MTITNEMWVAIIGAVAAIIGAIISTVSIIIANKNTNKIKLLENSKDVRTEISKKRLEVYKKIIKYINSWYDVKLVYDHDYIDCNARKYLKTEVFRSRLRTESDLIKEYKTVSDLSLEYFYLDAKSYQILKSLEDYMLSVINFEKTRDVGNFRYFCYIVYCDIWDYIFRLSKQVNKFIKDADTLKFKQSDSVKTAYAEKYFYRTNFFSIYNTTVLCTQFDEEIKQKIRPEIEKIDTEIENSKKELQQNKNPKIQKLISKKIRLLTKYRTKYSKIRFPKKCFKVKINDTYRMWLVCKNCKNEKCILSNSNGVKNEI